MQTGPQEQRHEEKKHAEDRTGDDQPQRTDHDLTEDLESQERN
jgi:hypothetical protein